jgi:hypothetical protein
MLDRTTLLKLAPALLLPGRGAFAGHARHCEYRAKASVLVLSIPILHRDNVGAGFLRIEEWEGQGERNLRLEFGAGSLPERAAGLNRMGLFEEAVHERGGTPDRAEYFGFMTSSPEENIEQAKAALKSGASGISAVRGRIEGGRIVNRLSRMAGIGQSGWARWREVAAEARDRIGTGQGVDSERSTAGQTVHTFLHAVNAAMRDGGSAKRLFVHNGEICRLETETAAEPQDGLRRITGKISKPGSRSATSFRVWFEPGPSPVPLRFEFRPRSFLRLSFERVS